MKPRRYIIRLMFVTMLAGGLSLARFNPEYEGLGLFGEVRYWLFYVLALIMCTHLIQKRQSSLPLGHVWRWLLVVASLHGYLIISVLWALNPADALGEIPDILLLMSLLLMACFIFRRSPERSTEFLLRTFFWVSLAFTLVAFPIAATLGDWHDMGEIPAIGAGGIGFSRITSTGALAATYLFVKTKRTYWLVPTPLLLLGAMFSGSRASVLGLAVASSLLIFPIWKVPKIKRLTALFFILTLSFLLFSLPFVKEGLAIFSVAWWFPGSDQPLYWADRDVFALMAWSIFLDYPVQGAGLGGFEQITGKIYPHNLILNIAAEGGIVGLVLLCVPLFLLLRRWFRARMFEHNAAACVGIFYFVASMFAGTYYDARFMWLFFLLYMMPASVDKMGGQALTTERNIWHVRFTPGVHHYSLPK